MAYRRIDSRISDFEKACNGNLLFVTADFRRVEMDCLGKTACRWYAAGRPHGPADSIAMDTLTLHHEIDEMPNGTLFALSSEWREVDDYYPDEYDEAPPPMRQRVMGDVIVDFGRETGKVAWGWKAFDPTDPHRSTYETLSDYWIRGGFPLPTGGRQD